MKKAMIWLLLAALIAGSGCSSESQKDDAITSGAEQPPQDTEQTQLQTEDGITYTLPEADYNGDTFVIASREPVNGSWSIIAKNPYQQEEETGDVIDDAIFLRERTIEEQYNINLEMFPYDFSKPLTVIKSMLAGDNLYDTIECSAWYINQFLAYHTLLVDYLSMDVVNLDHPWWEQTAIEKLSLGGRLYTITGDAVMIHPLSEAVIYFNKQIVDDYDLANPYQLVRDGKWTLDEMYSMSKIVASDLDGDNEMHVDTDRLGLMASDTSLAYFVRAAGFDLTQKNQDDIPVLSMYSEHNVNVMNKVQTMLQDTDNNYNTALVKPKNAVNGEAFYALVLPSFKSGRGLFHFNWVFIAMDLRDMEIDFGMLPMPKYDENQDNYISLTCDNWDTFTMIPYTDDERIARAGTILEALGCYGMEYLTPATIDKTVSSKAVRDEDSIEMMSIIMDVINYDVASIYDWGGLVSFFRTFGGKENKEFASYYAAKENSIMTDMEKTLEALADPS